uniref:succinate--CoA ligase (GDP-forming) n=1 Tax=Xiphophorus couchianus TaxID=32473 RepID=A0A3B5LG12_9TELE
MLAVFPRSELILPLSCSSFQCSWLTPRRWLNLQEYQSKKLMQDSGVAVQRFYVADTASEAQEAAKRLNAKEIVLKAQILAGGRGKGVFDSGLKGGVHLTKDPAVVGELAKRMLGFNLITKQTPKDGVKVKTVMVAEALDISRETYFAILMDRACNGPVMVGSPQGGMDIEEVADTTPELIFKEVIDIYKGVQDDQALRMAANLGFKGPLQRQAADQIKRLYDLFLKVDATQVEVNPLGETPEGQGTVFHRETAHCSQFIIGTYGCSGPDSINPIKTSVIIKSLVTCVSNKGGGSRNLPYSLHMKGRLGQIEIKGYKTPKIGSLYNSSLYIWQKRKTT